MVTIKLQKTVAAVLYGVGKQQSRKIVKGVNFCSKQPTGQIVGAAVQIVGSVVGLQLNLFIKIEQTAPAIRLALRPTTQPRCLLFSRYCSTGVFQHNVGNSAIAVGQV